MTGAMQKLTLGDIELSVIDPHERDTAYIYEEVFERKIYECAKFRVPDRPVILDVGANIGLYAIWAARRYQPAAIFCYEASPNTFRYLADNTSRHITSAKTKVLCTNHAVSGIAGQELVLHQAPFISGISTMLDEKDVPWVRDLKKSGELISHKVRTTTLSAELASNAIARVDILKIDVEGHFMEVFAGLQPSDFTRIGNIVLEAEYLEALQLTESDIHDYLRARNYATEAAEGMVYAYRKD